MGQILPSAAASDLSPRPLSFSLSLSLACSGAIIRLGDLDIDGILVLRPSVRPSSSLCSLASAKRSIHPTVHPFIQLPRLLFAHICHHTNQQLWLFTSHCISVRNFGSCKSCKQWSWSRHDNFLRVREIRECLSKFRHSLTAIMSS